MYERVATSNRRLKHYDEIRVNTAPPVSERPRCPYCKKPLRPLFRMISQTGSPQHGWIQKFEWQGEYKGYGAFDTLRCGVAYANLIVAAKRATP